VPGNLQLVYHSIMRVDVERQYLNIHEVVSSGLPQSSVSLAHSSLINPSNVTVASL